jgi:hypothetical protein
VIGLLLLLCLCRKRRREPWTPGMWAVLGVLVVLLAATRLTAETLVSLV